METQTNLFNVAHSLWYPCVNWDFFEARQQFWPDARPDAGISDSGIPT